MNFSNASSQAQFSNFNRNFLDPEVPLTCIGDCDLGGKASGIANIRSALNAGLNPDRFPGISVFIPSMVVICTDIFDAFMERNGLYKIAYSDLPDERIAAAFLRADLPFEVLGDLRALIQQVHTPLAVRSSSLLEDAVQEPFAGIYATKMIPNHRYDPDQRFRQLAEAIKFVYASTYFQGAKSYRQSTGHRDEEEKMGIILQDLVGQRFTDRFYPELSGVARSFNFYPMGPAKPGEGVVHLALGLGKTIVDGGRSWTYSPAYPHVEPPYGSVEALMKETQTEYWAVNMGEPPEYDPIHETEYLLLENLTSAERDGSLHYISSTYNPLSGRLSIGTGFPGPRALTFAPLLKLDMIPLNALVVELLRICETTLCSPVEIEFAMTFNPHRLGFLQVRPMVAQYGETKIAAEEFQAGNLLVACNHALGNGTIDTIQDIVFTMPEVFSLQNTHDMVPELELFNKKLLNAGRPYLLIALGRLGTTDPWLGIPIEWGKISGAKAVVETTRENVKVELSQGSHFFHNIISLGIKYFNMTSADPHQVDWDWLNRQEIVEEMRFVRHVQLAAPLKVKVDGRSSRGLVYRPNGET